MKPIQLRHTLPMALMYAIASLAPQQAPAQAPIPGLAQEAVREPGFITRTFHLSASATQAEQNEILTAVRNAGLPSTRIFLVPAQNAIVVRSTPDQVQQTGELIKELDHPHRQYRLTYTFTDIDTGKRIGVQRYSMVLAEGERMQMKEGSRIPIYTGSTSIPGQITKQATYLDVGLNFDSTVRDYGNGVQLKSNIEQSAVVAEKSSTGPEDPIIRQTRLEGTSYLVEGKPLVLGGLDVLGSTRRLEVEAMVEVIR